MGVLRASLVAAMVRIGEREGGKEGRGRWRGRGRGERGRGQTGSRDRSSCRCCPSTLNLMLEAAGLTLKKNKTAYEDPLSLSPHLSSPFFPPPFSESFPLSSLLFLLLFFFSAIILGRKKSVYFRNQMNLILFRESVSVTKP